MPSTAPSHGKKPETRKIASTAADMAATGTAGDFASRRLDDKAQGGRHPKYGDCGVDIAPIRPGWARAGKGAFSHAILQRSLERYVHLYIYGSENGYPHTHNSLS